MIEIVELGTFRSNLDIHVGYLKKKRSDLDVGVYGAAYTTREHYHS